MKIEKVNDHQIRCTLTKADLIDRELKISELAYGTEKAKNLFRDMMQQAAYEFGFEAEDIPLMIEAIPLNAECIVLIITKVEDPEELDTRFSKFAPSIHEEDDYTEDDPADDIMNLFRRLQGTSLEENIHSSAHSVRSAASKSSDAQQAPPAEDEAKENVFKMYCFDSFDQLIHLAHVLKGFYNGLNSVYKDPVNNDYKLIIYQSEHTTQDFNRVCNILSEYGRYERFYPAYFSYLEEHYEPLRKGDALQTLSQL
ncbi:MAG: adaptor protein MecA [Lachnospiraceae bacterium]|nr:adaptor protein MecA [Lachnospiraceae bacterium]